MAVALVAGVGMFAAIEARTPDAAAKERITDGIPKPPPEELRVPTPEGAAVFTDFSNANTLTDAQFQVLDGGTNVFGMKIQDGNLIHGSPTASNSASYLEAKMPAPVTRVGATALFQPGSSGNIALISWQTSIVEARSKTPPGLFPKAGFHFVADSTSWHLSVFTDPGGATSLMEGQYSLPTDGTPSAFEITREGDTVTVHLPDGSSHWAYDPRVGDWTGNYACWELYEFDHTKVPASISSAWAS